MHQKQTADSNQRMMNDKVKKAMKKATALVLHNMSLSRDHPDKRSVRKIVDKVNDEMATKLSDKTVHRYVAKGLVNTTPLKRGPAPAVPKLVYEMLKGAFSTFIMLEQAKCAKENSARVLMTRVSKCMRPFGYSIAPKHLLAKLRKDTADVIGVQKGNAVEHRRILWTTFTNLKLWFDTWERTVVELGLARHKTNEDGLVEGSVIF